MLIVLQLVQYEHDSVILGYLVAALRGTRSLNKQDLLHCTLCRGNYICYMSTCYKNKLRCNTQGKEGLFIPLYFF